MVEIPNDYMANKFKVAQLILTNNSVTTTGNVIYVNGVPAIGNSNLNGLISTGSADLRYLASGSSGQFYQKSNPNNFSSSGNVENTGTALQNQLGNYYLKSNPNNFSSSGNVENTGTLLQSQLGNYYLKSNPNNFVQSGQFVSGASITGGVAIQGALNLNAGSNITLTQQGANTVLITSAGGAATNIVGLISTGDADLRYLSSGSSGAFYASSNPNQFIKSGDVNNIYVHRTGNELISGLKIFGSGIAVDIISGISNKCKINLLLSEISDSNGIQAIGLASRELIRDNGDSVVNWNQGQLNNGAQSSIDWVNRVFYNSSNQTVIDYQNTALYGDWKLNDNVLFNLTGISITGGNTITGTLTINEGSNIRLAQQGNNILQINGVIPGGFSTSGNLEVTGTSLQNQITSVKNGTGVFIQGSNLQGLISTGSADLRYLQTGASGSFYLASNPSNFISSSNLNGLITTGSADLRYLQTGSSGEFIKNSNLNGLLSSGSHALINSITGISLSGGLGITGAININAGTNVVLTQQGSNTFNIAATIPQGFPTSGNLESTGTALQNQLGSYYLKTNPNNFSSSGNVEATGTALQNQLGSYYLKTNPNNFSSSGNVESTGTALQNQLGSYYLKTNPNNFSSSGNVENTGTAVVGLLGSYYLKTNPNNFSSSGNVENTGTSIVGLLNSYYLKTNPNNFVQSGQFISGVSVSGGVAIQGALNINAGSNITLTQAGLNSFTIASSAVGGGGLGGVTGVTVSGSTAFSGAINFIGAYGTNVIHSGNTIAISGGGGGSQGSTTNNYYVNSGSGVLIFRSGINAGVSKQFINLPVSLYGNPIIVASLQNDAFETIVPCQISGSTNNGFWAVFANAIPSTGYYLNVMAADSTGINPAANIYISTTNNQITNNYTGVFSPVTGVTITGGVAMTGAINIVGGGNVSTIQTSNNSFIVSGRNAGLTYLLYNDEVNGPNYQLSAALSGMSSTIINSATIQQYSKLILEAEVLSSANADAAAKPSFTWTLGWHTGAIFFNKQFVHRIITNTTAGIDGGGTWNGTIKTITSGTLPTSGTTCVLQAQCDSSNVNYLMRVNSFRVYGVV